MTGASGDDKVWVDEERKLEGIRRDVAEAFSDGLDVLVIAHFEDLLSVVAKRLRECSIEHRTHPFGDPSALCAKRHGGAASAVWLAGQVTPHAALAGRREIKRHASRGFRGRTADASRNTSHT